MGPGGLMHEWGSLRHTVEGRIADSLLGGNMWAFRVTGSGSGFDGDPVRLTFTPGSRGYGATAGLPSFDIDGTTVHLVDADRATSLIMDAAGRKTGTPLAVASINLDHIHHFGRSRRAARGETALERPSGIEWLNLVDGAPIARHISRRRGAQFPKLSGSDLIGPVLDRAHEKGARLAVLGGSDELTTDLTAQLAAQWPGIRFSGHWTPSRTALADPLACTRIAAEIRVNGADILLVCLGKPRQEEWIERYGSATGAGAVLAFGAVVDFIAGRVSRAPAWISRAGLEWAWRLALEPRRLARRYLVQGPPAYLALRRSR